MAQRGRPKGDGHQKQQILDAVIRLTVQQSSSTIRMRDVAEAADVSVGMIQHHFGSRDNLMDEASRRYLLDVVSKLRSIAAEDAAPWDKLIRLCRRAQSLEDINDRVVVWIDLLSHATREASPRESAQAINTAWTDLLAEVIAEGTSSGEFRPVGGARTVAEQLVAFVDGLDVAVASGSVGTDSTWRDDQLYSMTRILLGLPSH
ncbi:TetR/AcrR family transcriptional regulator [Saxibacter everestensis]|uniref:TetR/AcrR family transcriptional regulator n=1 Tax=Saxibacter everestensis TaxID=2909229 RepID=A0ABY8QYU8_9MICO|nr:TetR/AcrR family transcriptional regulator [Brevibacteriaceae bacterium ZFBP1038]